jgi:hypothetical protein
MSQSFEQTPSQNEIETLAWEFAIDQSKQKAAIFVNAIMAFIESKPEGYLETNLPDMVKIFDRATDPEFQK